MSWRARPPSQYDAAGGGSGSFWTFVITALVCLAVGLGSGVVLAGQSDPTRVDPSDPDHAAKRERLASRAETMLATVAKANGSIVLGEETRDVCATADDGFLARGWYDSACGLEVSWYIAAKGRPSAVKQTVRARMDRQHIPPASEFTWTEKRGPLPTKPSGVIDAVDARTNAALDRLQRGRALHFPERDRIYHNRVSTFDLTEAYRAHDRGRPVVARVSLVAQYAWT